MDDRYSPGYSPNSSGNRSQSSPFSSPPYFYENNTPNRGGGPSRQHFRGRRFYDRGNYNRSYSNSPFHGRNFRGSNRYSNQRYNTNYNISSYYDPSSVKDPWIHLTKEKEPPQPPEESTEAAST